MGTPTLEQVELMNHQSMITLFGFSFNVYAILIGLVILGVLIFIRSAQKDPDSSFDLTDVFTSIDQVTGKRIASGTKILQILGGITGTFIVIKMTLQNSMSFDIFAAYLAYVASIEGFSKFILARYGVSGGAAASADAKASKLLSAQNASATESADQPAAARKPVDD